MDAPGTHNFPREARDIALNPKVSKAYIANPDYRYGRLPHFGRTVNVLKAHQAFFEASGDNNAIAPLIYQAKTGIRPMPGGSKQRIEDHSWGCGRLKKLLEGGKSITRREAAFFYSAWRRTFGEAATVSLEDFVRRPIEENLEIVLHHAPGLWARLDPVLTLRGLAAMRACETSPKLSLQIEGTRWFDLDGSETPAFKATRETILHPHQRMTVVVEDAPTDRAPLVLVYSLTEGETPTEAGIRAAPIPHIWREGATWYADKAPGTPLTVTPACGAYGFLALTGLTEAIEAAIVGKTFLTAADLSAIADHVRSVPADAIAMAMLDYRVV